MRIQLEDVRFAYRGSEGDFRLHVPSLEIESGSRVALVGPSGSGKTTLLQLVAGILTPDTGRVQYGDVVLGHLTERERRTLRIRDIGLVLQEFELLDYLDLEDNILLPYHVARGLALTAAVRERAANLAREVGLGGKLGRRPRRLSHGEKQRAAVCRAVVTAPGLLLADEPTGSLDKANKEIVLRLLEDHAARSGATLLAVTHDEAELERFDRVVDVRSYVAATAAGGAA